ncbi:MAG: hypothetical protein APF80_12285 [Alphaproteobacteria bacterium BRH_c36]|nr:MAG: hypothetical protein APF80_12285 [Alphaproteobacteria bacterium BRH_c36]
MPVATHTKAAEDHKAAATAHETTAQLHTKGDHTAAVESSGKAKGCCDTAQKSTADAHDKSTIQAKK